MSRFPFYFIAGLLLTPMQLLIADDTKKSSDSPVTPAKKSAVDELRSHLTQLPKRPPLGKQAFSRTPLSKDQAQQALQLLLADRINELKASRKKEHDAKVIQMDIGGTTRTLKLKVATFGEKPANGRSLYISMHGGGGAPARVNDGQWNNQIRLYQPKEGIVVAPRAPTDTWDLWHQAHIDVLFDRLIENYITFEGVNPDKVYVMGYSAGGDGTYQLAPRMADRWAGAAMMAGHPGDAQTYNLRNLAYFIQCGGKDHAYNRANLAKEWGKRLDELAKSDPGGYPHQWEVFEQHGHWMKLDCKQAVPWMAQHTRNPWPKKMHWYQDNVTHTRFNWLANDAPKPGQLISAYVKGQTIVLTHKNEDLKKLHKIKDGAGDFTPIPAISLRLSDQLVDLDKPLIVKDIKGKVLFEGKVNRTIQSLYKSIMQRPDASSAASAMLTVKLDI